MQKPKFIGEGSFGCVIQPEVKCKKDIELLNKSPSNNVSISKLFLSREESDLGYFLKERKLAKLINKWDPNSYFFVAPSRICKTSVKEILKNPVSKRCHHIPDYSMKERTDSVLVNQLIMPNYGIDLADYIDKYVTQNSKQFPLKRWIHMLKNALLGLMVLQKHKYLHLDMKHSNMLYDEDKLRIIDFSLVTPAPAFYKVEQNKEFLKRNYFPNPLDYLLVYYFHYNTCSIEKGCFVFKEYLKTLKSFNAFNNFLKFYTMKDILNIVTDIIDWIHHTSNWMDIINANANKIDVYGLATVCITIDHDLDYSTVSNEEAIKYIQFIQFIANPDFRIRPTPVQAYEVYKQLF